jgi:hypothetical protein
LLVGRVTPVRADLVNPFCFCCHASVSASTAFMAELVEQARQSGKIVYRDGNRFSFGPYVGDLHVHLNTRLPENTFVIELR